MEQQNGNIRASKLYFLGPPSLIRGSNNRQPSNILSEQIFLKGIKNSYIGQISGRHEEIKELDYTTLFAPICEIVEQKSKKHRINFSSFKGMSTEQIIQRNKTDYAISEFKGEDEVQKQRRETVVLKSITWRNNKDIVGSSEGGCCGSAAEIKRAKLILQNQSTLQIYSKSHPNNVGENAYDKLDFNVNFDTVRAEVLFANISSNKQLSIQIGQYRIILQHEDRSIIEEWFKKIDTMYMQSKGRQFNLKKVAEIEQFYLREYQTQQFFTKNCQTGDIILFEDNHFFAKVQRVFTRSDFDHVAMVIRDQNYGILLLQANSGSGVSLTPWRSVIRYGWYQTIPRIVWRRLTCTRDDTFNQTIERFVKDNIQKCYHISFAKITSNVSMIHQPVKSTENKQSKQNNGEKEKEGYFCSQLVARLYKELGLLTRDTNNQNYMPAVRFYPKDFSTKANRKLDKGVLGREIDIFFDRNLLRINYKGMIPP